MTYTPKMMIERGDVDWERITNELYKLHDENGVVMYKSYGGEIVSAATVWNNLQERYWL